MLITYGARLCIDSFLIRCYTKVVSQQMRLCIFGVCSFGCTHFLFSAKKYWWLCFTENYIFYPESYKIIVYFLFESIM